MRDYLTQHLRVNRPIADAPLVFFDLFSAGLKLRLYQRAHFARLIPEPLPTAGKMKSSEIKETSMVTSSGISGSFCSSRALVRSITITSG